MPERPSAERIATDARRLQRQVRAVLPLPRDAMPGNRRVAPSPDGLIRRQRRTLEEAVRRSLRQGRLVG